MLFTIVVLSAVAMGVYLPYIVGEHEKDEERSLKDRGSIDKIQEDEDMWNDDIGLGVREYYELQERYDKAFTVSNLDRDASYMRELAQKRHDELLPIWKEKADEALNKILDDIERSVLNYEAKSEFFFEDMWDGNKNVLNILSAKISELGYESKIHVYNSLSTTLVVTLPDSESEDGNND